MATKQLSEETKRQFLELHIPHRLCLLTTFRDRQAWFKDRIEQTDGDLLRVAKDSALISIRMFTKFLRLMPVSEQNDDVFVDMLGGEQTSLHDLSPGEQRLIKGIHSRGNKELAHLTSTFRAHDEFNTAKAIVDATCLIERLLHEKLYKVLSREFPTLASERRIHYDHWQFVHGPVTDHGSAGW